MKTPAKPLFCCLLFCLLSGITGCERSQDSDLQTTPAPAPTPISDYDLRALLQESQVEPLDPLPELDEDRVELGRLLFFDPLLSGNRDISCATCHNPCNITGDDRSLSVGTAAVDDDALRLPGPNRIFIARHATELFNRGDSRWTTMFWDMRLAVDEAGRFVERTAVLTAGGMTPPEVPMPNGLDSLLAAQALFALSSRHEMRGRPGDVDIFGNPNEIASIPDSDLRQIWRLIMDRILANPEYGEHFARVYPDVDTADLRLVHAANALADFQTAAFTRLDSPFDLYLQGDDDALSEEAKRGAALFYGDAGCARCHGGALMTDQEAHNIGVPQLGPGREPGEPFDEGVYLRSHGQAELRFAFRTPPLRNVAVTGPWMHNGSYTTLEGALRHHLDPRRGLAEYDEGQLEPALRSQLHNSPEIQAEILETLSPIVDEPIELDDDEISDILAFLHSLTSTSIEEIGAEFPGAVPSGLPIEQCSTAPARQPVDDAPRPRSNREAMATLVDEIIDIEIMPTGVYCASLMELHGFGEFAGYSLMTAAKLLVANRWATISSESEEDHIDPAVIWEADIDDERHYHCLTSEAQQLLLISIAFDEILERREVLKRPSADDVLAFVEATGRIVDALITEARTRAQDRGASQVEAVDVGLAFRAIQREMGWTEDIEIPRHPPVSFFHVNFSEFLQRILLPPGSEDRPTTIPPTWRDLQIEGEALSELHNQLTEFTASITSRTPTMRPDNFIVNFDDGTQVTDSFLAPAMLRNAFTAQFPHHIRQNGDLRVYIGPNPGVTSRRDPEEITVNVARSDLDGLYRNTIAGRILLDVLTDSGVFLDPLILDYVVTGIARYLAFLLERSAQIAAQANGETITRAHVLTVHDWETSLVLSHTPELPGANVEARSTRHFIDVSQEAGFPATVENLDGTRVPARHDLQRAIGSGIAVGDITQNGYPDLYISGEGLNRLYLNRGEEAPGTFIDATSEWGLPEDMHDTRAALFVDFDGDGKLDLLIIRSSEPSLILRQTESAFVDVTEELGLQTRRGAHTAAVADFDGNGRLDIYIGYYGSETYHRERSNHMNTPSSDGRNGRANQLWRQGEDGRFVEVAQAAGVADRGWALATSAIDVDRNGLLDLYVVNDFGRNYLFRNLGDGTFEEISGPTRTLDSGAGMNASFADVTGNGFWDIYISNIDMFERVDWFVFPSPDTPFAGENALFDAFVDHTGNRLLGNREGPDGQRVFESLEGSYFADHQKGWSWAGVFFDFDLNGFEDFYLANGWISGTVAGNQKNQFYLRRGNRFELQSPSGVEAFAGNSRSAVAVDTNRNGRLDLIINNYRQPPVLLRNNSSSPNRSVQVRLQGPPQEPTAIGAIVELQSSGRTQIRQIIAGSAYLGQDDYLLTFGVGRAPRADITVHWPDGTTQSWQNQPTGRILDLEYSPAE